MSGEDDMPYRIRKQDCEQADGKSGIYVIQKKEAGKWKKVSCHASEDKAKSAMRARGMNEAEETLRVIIHEMIDKIKSLG